MLSQQAVHNWFRATITLSTVLLALLFHPLPSIAKGQTPRGNGYVASPLTSASRRFIPGQRLIYRLALESTSSSDLRVILAGQVKKNDEAIKAPGGLTHQFEFRVRGDLIVTTLANDGKHVFVAYRWQQPEVQLITNGQVAAKEASLIRAELDQEIFATLNQQGRIVSVRLAPSVSRLSRGVAQTMLALTQFVVPNQATAEKRRWESTEDDSQGTYTARYECLPIVNQTVPAERSNFITVRKVKVSYLPPAQQSKLGDFVVRQQIIPQGEWLANYDPQQGNLVSLEGFDGAIVTVGGKPIIDSKISLRMSLKEKKKLASRVLASLCRDQSARFSTVVAVPLSVTESEHESESKIHATELGSATLNSLLAELAQAEAHTEKADSHLGLYLKFKALIYLHPEVSTELGQMLVKANPQSLSINMLADALGAIGHPQAQSALCAALQARRADVAALRVLIPTLGALKQPTQQSEAILRTLVAHATNEEISSTAQLALGAMARNLARTVPARSHKIVDWIIQQQALTGSEESLKLMLWTLGNAGAKRALPTIKGFVHHPSSGVRAAAISALRFIESDPVNQLITEALRKDPEEEVRLEAAVALSFREVNAAIITAQKQAFQQEKNLNVRLAVLRNLGAAREYFPDIQMLIEEVASKETAKELREAATELLGAHPANKKDASQ